MVFIGVWFLMTNTMGIKTTDFILLVANSRNGMQVLSPEGGKTWLTATLEKRLKSNSYSIACQKLEPEVNRSSRYHGYECSQIHLQDIRSK